LIQLPGYCKTPLMKTNRVLFFLPSLLLLLSFCASPAAFAGLTVSRMIDETLGGADRRCRFEEKKEEDPEDRELENAPNFDTLLDEEKSKLQDDLEKAVASSDRVKTRNLIKRGVDPTRRDRNGKTLLHLVLDENLAYLMLKTRKLDPNAKAQKGITPLAELTKKYIAENDFDYNAYKQVSIALLRAGADRQIKDEENKTPIDYANEYLHELTLREPGHLDIHSGIWIKDDFEQRRVQFLPAFIKDSNQLVINEKRKREKRNLEGEMEFLVRGTRIPIAVTSNLIGAYLDWIERWHWTSLPYDDETQAPPSVH
jgi:hypothetical protein